MGVEQPERFKKPAENLAVTPPETDTDPTTAARHPKPPIPTKRPRAHFFSYTLAPPLGVLHKGLKKF